MCKFTSSYHGAKKCLMDHQIYAVSHLCCQMDVMQLNAQSLHYIAMAVLISCASFQHCRAEQTSQVSLCRYRVAS